MNPSRRCAPLLSLMLCALFIGPAQADDLGRLFTSTAERARIDAARSGRQPREDAADSVPVSDRVVINGTLRGSDGKRLVWVNGAPVDPQAARDLSLLRDGRVQLSWRDGAKILKPGQGVDTASGEVFDHHTPAPAPVVKETVTDTKPVVTPAPTPDAASATAAEVKPTTAAKAK